MQHTRALELIGFFPDTLNARLVENTLDFDDNRNPQGPFGACCDDLDFAVMSPRRQARLGLNRDLIDLQILVVLLRCDQQPGMRSSNGKLF